MNFFPLVGLTLTLVHGYLLAALLLPDPAPAGPHGANATGISLRWVRLAMMMPLGFGLTSLVYFAWLAAFEHLNSAYLMFEIAIALALLGLYLRAGLQPRLRVPAPPRPHRPGIWQVLLPAAYVLGMVGLIAAGLLGATLFTSGTTEAWSSWNLAARFLVSGGEPWTNMFSSLLPAPDKPLLYSASVARIWIFQTREAEWAPLSLGLIYALSASLLVAAVVSQRRGSLAGSAAGLAVLGASAFVILVPAQTADLLLAFYLLAAAACIYLVDIGYTKDYRALTLAGFFTGLALWTSNNAWFFLAAVLFSRLVWLPRRVKLSRIFPALQAYLVGLLPLVAYILLFRLVLIPNAPTVSEVSAFMERLFSLSHSIEVVRTLLLQLFEIYPRRSIPFLALIVFLLLAGIEPRARLRLANRLLLQLLLFSAALFAFSILISETDPLVRLNTLTSRRFISLWPLAVFYVFMIVRLPGIAVDRPLPARLSSAALETGDS